MQATSSYIQISDYAVIEYIYASEIITTSKAKTLRLYNNYNRQYQFLNSASATQLTGNVLDYSAVRIGADTSRFGYLDIDTVSPIVQSDSNIEVVDVSNLLLPSQKYDTIRLHILSGYDFPGLDGIILQIVWDQWNIEGKGGTPFIAASQVYLKGEERLEFNTTPLFLGDRLFDRYLEFKLPSLAEVNFDYWNSPVSPNSFGYQYTFENIGFQRESQIRASLFEIVTTESVSGNRYFNTGTFYSSSFNQQDLYAYISAVVQENPEFDYIEYYPTWNGQFLEDYIGLLNAGGGDWVVINQLEVYEQLGTQFYNTFSMTSLQEKNLNQPAVFRPVIRNAGLAISYTVEYTMRLLNKSNNQEIIRKATWSSANPKKYGEQLEKINVLEGFRPIKVYNKVVQMSEGGLATSVQYLGSPTIMTQNVYINSYYDVNYISVDSTTDLGNTLGQTVYPQGTNYIFINRFDNYVKFKIFTKSADKKQDVSLDLASTGMNVKLAFIYDDQSKIYLDPEQDMQAADPGSGEVLFRIDDSISTKLLAQTTMMYYIVNKNEKGDEVLIYSGKYADQKDRVKIMEAMNNSNTVAVVNTTPTAPAAVTPATTTTVDTGEVTVTATSVSNGALESSQASEISQAQVSTSTVQAASAGITQSLIDANSGKGKIRETLNIPDIPGVTPFMSGNIIAAITPNVIKPSNPSLNITPADKTSSALDPTKNLKLKPKLKKK